MISHLSGTKGIQPLLADPTLVDSKIVKKNGPLPGEFRQVEFFYKRINQQLWLVSFSNQKYVQSSEYNLLQSFTTYPQTNLLGNNLQSILPSVLCRPSYVLWVFHEDCHEDCQVVHYF